MAWKNIFNIKNNLKKETNNVSNSHKAKITNKEQLDKNNSNVFNNFSIKQKAKFFNKKNWLILFSFIGVGLTPLLALASPNNTTPFNTYFFKEMKNDDVTNNTSFSNLNLTKIPYANLLRGTTNYNDGNYVLYLGTLACPDCNNLLFGPQVNAKQSYIFGNGIGENAWKDGGWGQVVQWAASNTNNETIKNLKFLMFEDMPPDSVNRFNDNLWTLPWSTHTSTNYENGIIAGDYIRYDESAINFRKIFNFAQSIYSQVRGTPTLMYFKNGVINFGTTNSNPRSKQDLIVQLSTIYANN